MSVAPDPDPKLPSTEMTLLTAEVKAMARRLSRDQLLDLADVLHQVIRERQVEHRSWKRQPEPAA